MKQKTYRNWYQVHKWTSLVCTLFMLLLCVTGLPLIFHHEIDHWLGYSTDVPEIEHTGPAADADAVVADALARRPAGEAVQFLVADADEPGALYVRLGTTVKSADMSAFFTYDARTGEFLGDYPLGQGIMNVLLRLHVDLFAGLPGTLFLGFMGLLLLASIVSGAVVYGPHVAKSGFEVRRQRSRRLRWLDLHNLLGIVTLVWLFVVTVTGVINTLSIPIFADWQATELADMTAGYQDRPPPEEIADLDAVLAAADRSAPDKQLSFLAFPGNEFASPHHFTAFMQGSTALTSKLLTPVLIDAETAAVVDTRSLPWTVSALLLSQPLHFGDYGGMPMKILWALLDLITIIVLVTGLYLWLKRRESPVRARQTGAVPTDAAAANAALATDASKSS